MTIEIGCWVPGCGAGAYYRLRCDGYKGTIIGFCGKHEPWLTTEKPRALKIRGVHGDF